MPGGFTRETGGRKRKVHPVFLAQFSEGILKKMTNQCRIWNETRMSPSESQDIQTIFRKVSTKILSFSAGSDSEMGF